MGVRFERRAMGALDGRGLLYSLGAENGSPVRWEIASIGAMALGGVFLARALARQS